MSNSKTRPKSKSFLYGKEKRDLLNQIFNGKTSENKNIGKIKGNQLKLKSKPFFRKPPPLTFCLVEKGESPKDDKRMVLQKDKLVFHHPERKLHYTMNSSTLFHENNFDPNSTFSNISNTLCDSLSQNYSCVFIMLGGEKTKKPESLTHPKTGLIINFLKVVFENKNELFFTDQLFFDFKLVDNNLEQNLFENITQEPIVKSVDSFSDVLLKAKELRKEYDDSDVEKEKYSLIYTFFLQMSSGPVAMIFVDMHSDHFRFVDDMIKRKVTPKNLFEGNSTRVQENILRTVSTPLSYRFFLFGHANPNLKSIKESRLTLDTLKGVIVYGKRLGEIYKNVSPMRDDHEQFSNNKKVLNLVEEIQLLLAENIRPQEDEDGLGKNVLSKENIIEMEKLVKYLPVLNKMMSEVKAEVVKKDAEIALLKSGKGKERVPRVKKMIIHHDDEEEDEGESDEEEEEEGDEEEGEEEAPGEEEEKQKFSKEDVKKIHEFYKGSMEEINEDLDSYQKEIDVLSEENRILKGEGNVDEKIKLLHEKEKFSMSQTIEQLKEALIQAQENTSFDNERIEDEGNEDEITRLEQQNDKIQDRCDKLEEEKEELQDAMNVLNDEMAELRTQNNELSTMDGSKQTIVRLQEQNSILKMKLESLNKNNNENTSSTSSSLGFKQEGLDEIKEKNNELQIKIEELLNSINILNDELDEKREDLTQKKKENEYLNGSLQEINVEMDVVTKEKEDLLKKVDEYEKGGGVIGSEVTSELKQENSLLLERIHSFQEEESEKIRNIQSENESLKLRFKEVEKIIKDNEEKKKIINRMQKKMELLKVDNLKNKSMISKGVEKLKFEIEKVKRENEKYKFVENKKSKLSQKKIESIEKRFSERLERLKTKFKKEAYFKIKDLQIKSEKIKQLETSLRKKNNEIVYKNGKYKRLKNNFENLKREYNRLFNKKFINEKLKKDKNKALMNVDADSYLYEKRQLQKKIKFLESKLFTMELDNQLVDSKKRTNDLNQEKISMYIKKLIMHLEINKKKKMEYKQKCSVLKKIIRKKNELLESFKNKIIDIDAQQKEEDFQIGWNKKVFK